MKSRSKVLRNKPHAAAWMKQNPSASRNIKRIVQAMAERYLGSHQGYIDRSTDEVEYRFGRAADDLVMEGAKLIGRKRHTTVRFHLYGPYAHGAYKSRTIKNRLGYPHHVLDIVVEPYDALTALNDVIGSFRTFGGEAARASPEANRLATQAVIAGVTDTDADFDPGSVEEARQRALRALAVRRGQSAFRKRLVVRFDGKCAISGCKVDQVLEAAHITPYRGTATNHVQNGLLLRADLHTLWDRGLLAIEPESGEVWVGKDARLDEYKKLHGRKLGGGWVRQCAPALAEHWRTFVQGSAKS
jgi:hypothetical protein